jgi:hypothetical protein
LPRGIGIAKPSGHGAHGAQQGVPSEGGIIVESDGLAQCGFDPSEHCQHDRNGLSCGLSGKPGGERHAGFALMQNEHRPCALTKDEVTLPMAALGSAVDSLGPFVDGDTILDGILRRSRSIFLRRGIAPRGSNPIVSANCDLRRTRERTIVVFLIGNS